MISKDWALIDALALVPSDAPILVLDSLETWSANDRLRLAVMERVKERPARVSDLLHVLDPFKPFGAPSLTVLQKLGYAEEAQDVLALEAAVRKRKNLSPGSILAAKAAGQAALQVQAELKAIPKLTKARTDAMTRRDALAQAWETAFAGLKRAARAAEDDGARGLYGALFRRAKAAKRKKAAEPKGETK